MKRIVVTTDETTVDINFASESSCAVLAKNKDGKIVGVLIKTLEGDYWKLQYLDGTGSPWHATKKDAILAAIRRDGYTVYADM